jgi:hypothetical protein
MKISKLPQLPPGSTAASLLGLNFVGPTQYGLGVLFVSAQNAELYSEPFRPPTIGDLRIGPGHIMDAMARDYALLPEDMTAMSQPMGVCCVRAVLPACEKCGDLGRYDIWVTAAQGPLLLCEGCAGPLEGLQLGFGTATAIFTVDEMPWTIRDICDRITEELGRPSLWA